MRRIAQMAASGLLILVLVAPASAAGKPGEKKSASWVVSYALVFLGTGLGVAAVCRNAHRSKKIPETE